MMRPQPSRFLLVLLATVPVLAACDNAGADLGVGLPGNRGIAAQVFYDRDFNGVASAGDTAIAGIPVYLLVAGGAADTVAVDTTDATGTVGFSNLAPGPYTISVDSVAALGDSMFSTISPLSVQVAAGGPTPVLIARLDYPVVSVAQARSSPAGRRIVVSGLILAGRQSFSDSSAYLRDTATAVRLTNATVIIGGFVTPGDSVKVLGTRASRAGQAVLDAARIALVQPGFTSPRADTVTTQVAAGAGAGSRDADLVHVQAAEIIDTATVGGHFRVIVNDGSGALQMLVDSIQGVNLAPILPGDSVNVTGVLVPSGGLWQLKPRAQSDLQVF